MNTRLNKIALATALLAGLAGFAQAHTVAGATPADITLATNVKTALMQAAPFQDADADVKISASNGKVDLTGWVTYGDDEGLAQSIAQSVPGVTAVTGSFRTWSSSADPRVGVDAAVFAKPSTDAKTSSIGSSASDVALAANVKAALQKATPFQDALADVSVKAVNGKVNLSGWVSYADNEALARQIASSVDGVQRVTTNLRSWSSESDVRL